MSNLGKKYTVWVYKITNREDGRNYVGQSIDPKTRFNAHKSGLQLKLGSEYDWDLELIKKMTVKYVKQKYKYKRGYYWDWSEKDLQRVNRAENKMIIKMKLDTGFLNVNSKYTWCNSLVPRKFKPICLVGAVL